MDFNSLFNFEDVTDQYDPAEIENSKALAILAYLISFLFFLPYVSNNQSQYAKFVSNQAFTIFVVGVAGGIVTRILGIIPILGSLIQIAFSLAFFALAILGVIDSASGRVRKLPVVGKFIIEIFK